MVRRFTSNLKRPTRMKVVTFRKVTFRYNATFILVGRLKFEVNRRTTSTYAGGNHRTIIADKARSLRHSATAASPRVLARRDDHVRRSYISGSRSWPRFKQLTPP
eukprot:scaffold124305_cov57-Phaeocystis_antarctica.AAC.1